MEIYDNVVIGITGVARAGKDTFADVLIHRLKVAHYIHAEKFSIANQLKEECKDFIKEKLGIDVFTNNTEEKNKIRDMLVWYGNLKRKDSQGKHWTNLLNEKIKNSKASVNIITDVRYCEYPTDELFWLKEQNNGILVHLKRFVPSDGVSIRFNQNSFVKRHYVKPANKFEEENDPKLFLHSDFRIEWEDQSYFVKKDDFDPKTNDYIVSVVENFIKELKQNQLIY